MFDPAPEYVVDKQKNKTQAYDFLIRVRNAALHYEVYGDNRIELINAAITWKISRIDCIQKFGRKASVNPSKNVKMFSSC